MIHENEGGGFFLSAGRFGQTVDSMNASGSAGASREPGWRDDLEASRDVGEKEKQGNLTQARLITS